MRLTSYSSVRTFLGSLRSCLPVVSLLSMPGLACRTRRSQSLRLLTAAFFDLLDPPAHVRISRSERRTFHPVLPSVASIGTMGKTKVTGQGCTNLPRNLKALFNTTRMTSRGRCCVLFSKALCPQKVYILEEYWTLKGRDRSFNQNNT